MRSLVRETYDPCYGTGGILTLAKDTIQVLNRRPYIYLFRQEVNPETCGVCESELHVKDPTRPAAQCRSEECGSFILRQGR